MKYTVDKGRVNFTCPRCNAILKSPLSEAGTKQSCPDCGGQFVTPGEPELRQAEQRAQMEEAQRQEAERSRRVQDEAARKLAEAERVKRQQERQQQQALVSKTTGNWADRFLAFAFSFGKYASVIVVGLCFVSLIVFVVRWMAVTEKDVEPPLAFAPPTAADFGPPPAPKGDSDDGGTGSSPATGAPDPNVTALNNLLRPLGINPASIMRHVDLWVTVDPKQFVLDLAAFIQAMKSTGRSVNESVIKEYAFKYVISYERHEAEVERAERNRQAAAAEAAAERDRMRMMVLGSVAVLMMFLFLPLAIQIERNTRKLNLLD